LRPILCETADVDVLTTSRRYNILNKSFHSIKQLDFFKPLVINFSWFLHLAYIAYPAAFKISMLHTFCLQNLFPYCPI